MEKFNLKKYFSLILLIQPIQTDFCHNYKKCATKENLLSNTFDQCKSSLPVILRKYASCRYSENSAVPVCSCPFGYSHKELDQTASASIICEKETFPPANVDLTGWTKHYTSKSDQVYYKYFSGHGIPRPWYTINAAAYCSSHFTSSMSHLAQTFSMSELTSLLAESPGTDYIVKSIGSFNFDDVPNNQNNWIWFPSGKPMLPNLWHGSEGTKTDYLLRYGVLYKHNEMIHDHYDQDRPFFCEYRKSWFFEEENLINFLKMSPPLDYFGWVKLPFRYESKESEDNHSMQVWYKLVENPSWLNKRFFLLYKKSTFFEKSQISSTKFTENEPN